jgi:hypothetical protein
MTSEKTHDDQYREQVSGSEFDEDAGGVDAGDMYRMGKEQQFKVVIANVSHFIRYSDISSVSFVSQP